MTKPELETALKQSIQEFSKEVEYIAKDPYGKKPITEGELVELTRQIYYVLDNLKTHILEYLD